MHGIRGFIGRRELDKTTTTASFLPHSRSAHKWSTIVLAVLMLVFATAGQAKAEVLFAAVWEKGGGPAFQARHNLTAAQYQQTFDELVGQGFRPRVVSGYAVGGEPRFAAIWEKDGGPAFQARHNLTAAQYQQTFNELVGQGFRLKYVNGYTIGGEPRFAAIWEKDGGPAFQARHNLTAAQYQQTFDQLVGQGFRLRAVSGYEVAAIRPPPANFTCAVCNNGSCQCGSQTQSQLCANHGGVDPTLGCIQQE